MILPSPAAVRAWCRAQRPKAAEKLPVSHHPTRMEFDYITAPMLYAKLRELRPLAKGVAGPELLNYCYQLVETGNFTCRDIAYGLLEKHKAAAALLDRAALERLGAGNDNWASVDTFGAWCTGPAWLRRQISDGTVRDWSRSPDLWWRRTALVSTTVLNKKSRGGTGDTQRTLMICGMLAADREPLVIKAVSWALRELVPWDRRAVEDFMQERDADLAAQVKREVATKLRTGKKNR